MVAALLTISLMTTQTQDPAHTPNEYLPLWPRGIPDGWAIEGPEEQTTEGGILRIKNISYPWIELFMAKNLERPAPMVLVIPGGGYNIVAYGHEGTEVAEFLNKNGFNAAVLKYRLPRPEDDKRHWPAFQDAQRALRILREFQTREDNKISQIGVLGFSAGGHLAATLSTQSQTQTYQRVDDYENQHAKPDFTALIYPAYLVSDQGTLHPEFKVDKDTPPAFLVHTHDDGVTPLSSLAYATALQKAKVPYALHLYPQGGHGYGLRPTQAGLKEWPDQLVTWLKNLPAPK